MTDQLRISKDLSLPVEIAGEAVAILAKRGAGKTNTAIVLVEELHAKRVQTVILDPVGVWWGIRAGSDGNMEGGLAIPVLGGEHGDVPLEPAAGELVADVAVDNHASMVVDVSEFSKTQQRTFVAAFAQRLYRRKAKERSLLHVVLEEADEFAPQRVPAGDAPMVGAISQLMKRGRSRGIGMTVITQRSASLNKDVLDQADVLIAMRTTGPRDRKAIESWVEHQGEDNHDVVDSLSRLDTGQGWVWNPERKLLRLVKFRARTTFDSSATPGRGTKRSEPKETVPIDLAQLGAKIAETAERAKQNDPNALRKQIRDLERKLAARPTAGEMLRVEVPVEKTVEKIVEKPVFTAAERKLIERACKAIEKAGEAMGLLAPLVNKMPGHVLVPVPASTPVPPRKLDPRYRADTLPSHASETGEPVKIKYSQQRPSQPPPANQPRYPDMSVANGQVTPAQQKVLDALAWFENVGVHHPSRAALAPLAGTRPTSGGFKNNLGALRTAGLLDYPTGGRVALTDAGRDQANHPDIPATNESMQHAIRQVVPPAQWRILDALIDVWPNSMSRERLANEVGVPVTSGGFKNNLGALRTLELIDYPQPGHVHAEPILFPQQ